MSARSWKAVLELGQQEKKSELDDDDRVETVTNCLLENKAPKCCFDADRRSDLQCECLACLDDRSFPEEFRCPVDSVTCSTGKRNATNANHGENPCNKAGTGRRQQAECQLAATFHTICNRAPQVATVLGDVKICKFAAMPTLRMGRVAWSTCKQAVESGSNPQMGWNNENEEQGRKNSKVNLSQVSRNSMPLQACHCQDHVQLVQQGNDHVRSMRKTLKTQVSWTPNGQNGDSLAGVALISDAP